MELLSRSARRFALALVLAGVVLVALACSRHEIPPDPPKPFSRLVVVMIDTLRSDHLEAYGYSRNTAPFLAELAAEGIQVQGTSASSWTRSSVATALTGLHPQRHQATSRSDRLPQSVPFLAEILAGRGFDTAAYVANPVVGREFGFARGYDRFREYGGGKNDKPAAAEVTDRALALVKPDADEFFLYVHFLDPHDPYVPRRAWGRDDETEASYVQPRDVIQGGGKMTPEYLQRLRDQYDGAIVEMDQQIRRLLEGLGDQGLLEDCLVVVTSDHGELFGEHGGLTHGRGLWQEEILVPLLFWSRDGLVPLRTEGIFHQVDLLPTLLDALGIEPPSSLDGRSLWADLSAGSLPQRDVQLYSLDLGEKAVAVGVVRWPHKLIHRTLQPSTLLFRLDRDPEEATNLVRDGLRDELLFLATDLHSRLSASRFPRSKAALEKETRRQLEALGYIDPTETSDEVLESRYLPHVLTPRSSRPFEVFAGLRPSELRRSLDPRRSPLQLLRGWPLAWRDPKGFRCRDQASLVLGSRGLTDLVLEGNLPHDSGEIRLDVRCDDGPERTFELQPGKIRLKYPNCVQAPSRRAVYVELRRRSERNEQPGVYWTRFALVGSRAAGQGS